MNNSKKLIIWDFDGVIADTEKLWLKNRVTALNEKFNLNWDIQKANHIIGGMSDKTKIEVLNNLGIHTGEEFWNDMIAADNKSIQQGFTIIAGVEDIMKHHEIKQCIATGGTMEKTLKKVAVIALKNIFPLEKIFVADMVEKGKPAPDLFLYACKEMGETPENTIVIEDSVAGLTAAVKAGMTPIAFIGTELNNNREYAEKIRKLGVTLIFDKMKDIENYIFN